MSALERRRLGRTNLQPTRLALGAAHMGGMVHAITIPEVRATLQRMYDLGVRYLDTSPLYGNSQENLGKAMEGMDLPELLISTKVGTHASRPHSYTAEDLRWSLDDSSRLLGREKLDLVLIHDPVTMEPVFAAGDGFDTLEALRDEGRLEAIGLGVRDLDFHRQAIDAGRVDAILTYADYSLVRQTAAPLIRHAKANGVGVILGSPQLQGLLAHGDPMIALKVRPNLADLYPPEDIQRAREWWAWCRERQVELRHLNMRFVLANEDIDVVLTGAASAYEMEINVREATSAIPADIWAEALERVAELVEQAG